MGVFGKNKNNYDKNIVNDRKELSEEERAELRKKTIEKYIAISDAMNEAERQERLKNAKSENQKVDPYAQEIQRLAKQQGNNVVQRQSITLEELQNKNRSKGSEVQTPQQPPQSQHPNPVQPYFAQTEEQKRQEIIRQAQLAETPVNTVTTKKTRAESRAGSIIGLAINIGRREYQQDAIAVSDPGATQFTPDKMFMAVLCDGMGGMNGGEKASALCIKEMLESFKNTSNDINVPAFFRNSIIQIDNDVAGIEDEYGNPLGAGSTLISVIIRGNELYWASVGDSHIYILRGDQLYLVNKEHNYLADLLVQVERGNITIEDAYNDPHKEALTSFMGIGCIELIDLNSAMLQKGDCIILTSDGLYRSLSKDEICNTVKANINDMQRAATALVDFAVGKGNPHQDNTSVIALRVQ